MILKNLLKKPNYTQWSIDPADFPTQGSMREKMLFLLGFTILAPSGHNTQPWLFEINENRVTFLFSTERSLHDSDPEGRQLLIAFGCAIENFFIAAKHFGFEPKLTILPFPKKGDNKICMIECLNTSPTPQQLLSAITKRHTNRKPFSDTKIPENLIEYFNQLSNESIKIVYIEDSQQKEKIADLAIKAQIATMEGKSFRSELSQFIRSSFTKSYTGMPGFALGIPSLVSLFASPLIKLVNLSKKSEKKDREIIKKTSGYIVITSKEDSPLFWIETGRIFEHAWLTATINGVVFSPLAAVVQEQDYKKKFENTIGTNFHVVAFARVGIPFEFSLPSPRYPAKNLVLV